MPISPYGVLVGKALDRRREGAPDDTPHYQVLVEGEERASYRVAVNVKSKLPPSDLLYLIDDDFRHPLVAEVDAVSLGWHPLTSSSGGAALDYVRGNLFAREVMRPLPPDVEGPDNDLSDLFDHYVGRAVADPGARVFAFGERWGPDPGRDEVFGFEPNRGVHNIHMNQGNSPQFARDNGVWQDGAFLVHFPGQSRWVAIFLAFQSQAWHTDDRTGDAITRPEPQPGPAGLQIVAALVNPQGPGPEAETVTLINASPEPADLAGWRLADRLGRTSPVPPIRVPPGATLIVPVSDGLHLGNSGGTISLLDAQGLKVHGVAYTVADGGREGWTLVF